MSCVRSRQPSLCPRVKKASNRTATVSLQTSEAIFANSCKYRNGICTNSRKSLRLFERVRGSLFRGQGSADDFLVVSREHAFVRVGGVTPHDLAPQTDANGLQQLGSAHFVVLLGRQVGDDQVAVLAEEEEAI